MKLSVIAPVKNEAQFIGFSIMAVLPHIHEIIYPVQRAMTAPMICLIIHATYAKDKLQIHRRAEFDFNVHDMAAYNSSFNFCIEQSSGDAVWFLHPDMIVTNPEAVSQLNGDALAYFCTVKSYAKDGHTLITKGRTNKWKHIHRKTLGHSGRACGNPRGL